MHGVSNRANGPLFLAPLVQPVHRNARNPGRQAGFVRCMQGSDAVPGVVRTRYVYTLGPGEGGGKLIGNYVFSDFGAPMDDVIPSEDEVLRLEDAVAE